jgi:hypothetical protein
MGIRQLIQRVVSCVKRLYRVQSKKPIAMPQNGLVAGAAF